MPDMRCFQWWCRLFVIGFCASLTVVIADDEKPAAKSPPVERLLAWFPVDTETVVAASSFHLQAPVNLASGKIDLIAFAQTLACGELATLDNRNYLKPLVGKKVTVAMRGDRHFETVSAFGAHRSEGCAIVVFEEDLGEAGNDWINLLRQGAKDVRMIRGRDVFVFPPTLAMEGIYKIKPWQRTCFVLLKPDTLLCATSDVYLEEVLQRVDTRPADRALPDTLAEWRRIDPSAPSWMIRHIPGSNAKRLIDGVTWSTTIDRVNIEYLSVGNAEGEVEAQARTRWQSNGVDFKSDFKRSTDGSVIVSLDTSVNDPDSFLAKLFLYALQNESGAVGAQ